MLLETLKNIICKKIPQQHDQVTQDNSGLLHSNFPSVESSSKSTCYWLVIVGSVDKQYFWKIVCALINANKFHFSPLN